jgi:uncharacterized membrane protein
MIGLAVELLVSGLLATTIGYCVVLERRLRRFRADEATMRQTIVDLVGATETAERSIRSLRDLVQEADHKLAGHLRQAEASSADLARQVEAGGDVIARIARIVGTAAGTEHAAPRPAPAHPPAPTPQPAATPAAPRLAETLAAAQAFADRARQRLGGRAA